VQKPKTKRELWGFIAAHFNLRLPWKTFTPGHSNPFDFVADAVFHPGADLAAWANRSGAKTLVASVIAALDFLYFDGLQARVLSGSEDQAKYLYEYWQQWCGELRGTDGRVYPGPLAYRLNGPINRMLTEVGGGRFEILAASQKKVRGPKVQRLYKEELDEIDPEIDQAALGMLDSRTMPARTIHTSTWHRADGLMGKLVQGDPARGLKGCPDNGVRLHRWNLWESIEHCPPERHGNGPNCLTCPLGKPDGDKFGPCLAKAKEIWGANKRVGVAGHACGLYKIDDAIKVYRQASLAMWDAEYLCKRPSVEGLVWPEFDEHKHCCKTPPDGLKVYRVIDWGLVFVCLWIGVDKDERAYLLDTYRWDSNEGGARTLKEHADEIKKRPWTIHATYCDPAGASRDDQTGRTSVEIFQAEGIPCQWTNSSYWTNIQNGVETVRAKLNPAGGPPLLYYVPTPNNRIFVTAMYAYQNAKVNGVWIPRPKDPQPFEHIPDALRYFFINRESSKSSGSFVKGFGAS